MYIYSNQEKTSSLRDTFNIFILRTMLECIQTCGNRFLYRSIFPISRFSSVDSHCSKHQSLHQWC